MSNDLSAVSNAAIRTILGDRCLNKAGLLIDETDAEDVKIAAAVQHTINGVFQTDLAVAAKIDLSAATVISAKDGSTLSATVSIPATDADTTHTKTWVLAAKGNEAFIVEPELDVAAAQDDADYSLVCPAGYAAFGVIKVVQPVSTAAFTLGTTALTTIGSFFDVCGCPGKLANLVEN